MMKSLNNRVLVVDDNHAIHEDFCKILGQSGAAPDNDMAAVEDAIFGDSAPAAATSAAMEIDSSYQGQDGFARVEQARRVGRPYAVAFVDMRMPPGWDGLRTVREIWRCDPDINIVICTAFSDHSWKEIEAVDEAGDRLLVLKKPFEPIEVRRLAATLTAKWTLARQAAMKMAELEQVVDARTIELHQAATHDRLTGLPNRMLFHERLTQAMAAAKRGATNDLAVLFLDFDRFKIVNDSLGHAGGDQLLRNISTRLTTTLKAPESAAIANGLVARLGGDEFCVLLTGLRNGPSGAAVICERLLNALATPYDIGGCQVQSSASIGVAMHSANYTSADEMIRDADTAMYRAKADGKGRFVLFDATMHEQAMQRLMTEIELRQAISTGELEMFYQPIVSTESARPTGAEALIRWRHPRRGLVSPAEFIPIAEETGLIYNLGLFAMESSFRQLAAWDKAHPGSDLSISVNVSPRQLTNPAFNADVAALLERTGACAKRLILEITETALVGNTELAAQAISALQKLGLRVYLDDFGTGYSSLSLLHTIRLDGLKIDRSFIREAVEGRPYAAIVHAVTELACNLKMEVVAEGIETIEQLMMLQGFHCEKAQGYLFSKPMPAADFERRYLSDASHITFGLPNAA